MFSLKLVNERNNEVDINDGERYQVTFCSGLNPPSATLYTAKSPNRKGVKYNGSTLNERHIVIVIKLLGDIEQNRNALYDWVNTENYVKVLYTNGMRDVYAEGHITDADIDLFTASEEVSLAITCGNPYWRDLEDISISISTILSMFSFPFGIEASGIPFSEQRDSNDTIIVNTGAKTGCVIEFEFRGDVEGLKVYNARELTEQDEFTGTFHEGEILRIDSENMPKRITLTEPNGTVTSALSRIIGVPQWFELERGSNAFGFVATAGEINAILRVRYTNKYLGV